MIKSGLLRDYTLLISGLLIFSVSYACFTLPYEITCGGVSGVAAVIFYATGFKASISYSIINIIFLLLGMRILGWRYVLRTLFATLFISVAVDIMQQVLTLPDGTLRCVAGEDRFLACVVGGLCEGLGLSLVFMGGGSTGGTDIIASCVNKYWNISLGRFMQFLDVLIISSSFLVFHEFERVVYGFVITLVSLNFMDYVMLGAQQSVQFTIISDRYDEIANRVSSELDRGATLLHAQGWYSKQGREVLLIMARKRESSRIFALIRNIDPNAFVTMSKVAGVFGEGFDTIKK